MNLSKSYQDLISYSNYRIMLLDGGFAAMLRQLNLTEADFRGKMFADHYVELKGDNDVLCLTAPDKVKDIHLAYLEAGVSLIRTNTFGATSFGQAKYRLQNMAYDIAKAGAQVACDAVKIYNERRKVTGAMITPKFVVGSIGPTGKMAGESFAELAEAYGEQVRGLLDGGADVLLVESVFDTLSCKAALYAICKECEKRGELYPIMVSATIDNRNGRLKSGQTARALWHSVSGFPIFSVGFEGASAADFLPHLRSVKDAYVRVSAIMDGDIPDDLLVNIVGGCGTTPATIRSFMRTLAGRDPRRVPSRNYNLLLSGLDPMEVAPGSGLVDVAPPEQMGKIIRVDLDAGLEDPKSKMPCFLKDLLKNPSTADRPVMIESVRWDVLLAGMECVQGKGIVKSISLKEGELVFLARAEEIRRHGFAVVCKAEDENGLALTYSRRVDLFEKMYRLLVGRLDFLPEDILFDPCVCPVGTGRDEYPESAKDFFESCRYVKEKLPRAHVIGELSLLNYAYKEDTLLRDSMHAVFLYHAGLAGMDFAIVDTVALPAYDDVPLELRHLIEDLLFNRSPEATDALLEYAEASVRSKSGGTLGKIFMPRLEKRLAELKLNSTARPPFAAKFVLASMDSIVHDIDRDILVKLLSNYGFPVVDLGCGCSCEKVMESLVCEQPDIVYLSAQFASGFSEMLHVVREFKKNDVGTVLVVGGEIVTDRLAAVRLAPEALGPVVYVSDMRKIVKVVEALADDSKRPAFLAALKAHQDRLRLS